MLIQQSFDVFNIYGKEPEQAKNILQGFYLSLENVELKYIQWAFKEYMKTNKSMPTPSEILFLANSKAKDERDYGALKSYSPAPRQNTIKVPWYGLGWRQINERGFLPQVEEHLMELAMLKNKSKADEYLKYLKGLK